MPTTAATTFSLTAVDPVINADDAMASMVPVRLKASTTFVAGTVLGEITASPGTYGPYVTGHTDGTQNPAGILRRGAITDSSGNITNYDEWGGPGTTRSMYTEGAFRLQDLIGLDAGAVTALGGHIIEGALGGNGIFSF